MNKSSISILRFVMTLAMLLITTKSMYCIERSRVQIALDYHYSLGISQKALGKTIYRNDMEMHGNSIHVSGLYNINRQYGVGIGLGLDIYSPSPTTLPIYGTFRYRPFDKINFNDLFVFTNIGYGIPANDDDSLSSGFLFDIGLGWQRMLRKHFGLELQIGYNLKQFRATKHEYAEGGSYQVASKFSAWRNSISFGFGFVF